MKTRFVLTIAMAAFAYGVSAQKIEMTKKLTRDEVPVVVVQALQRDFSTLPENGTWTLFYFEDVATAKLTPEFYQYACKKDNEKVEIYYKPDGTLDHTKGINPPTHVSQP